MANVNEKQIKNMEIKISMVEDNKRRYTYYVSISYNDDMFEKSKTYLDKGVLSKDLRDDVLEML